MWDRGEGVTSFNLFDRLKPGNHRPAAGVWVDSGRVEKSGVAWEDGLRRVLQAVGREPCLGKDMTLDIVGHGLRVSFRLLGLAVVIQVIRPEALKCHVWAPGVVPAFEFGAQKRQMVKSLDKRHASQPLVFESLDDSLGYGDGSVLAYGSEPRFDVPSF